MPVVIDTLSRHSRNSLLKTLSALAAPLDGRLARVLSPRWYRCLSIYMYTFTQRYHLRSVERRSSASVPFSQHTAHHLLSILLEPLDGSNGDCLPYRCEGKETSTISSPVRPDRARLSPSSAGGEPSFSQSPHTSHGALLPPPPSPVRT